MSRAECTEPSRLRGKPVSTENMNVISKGGFAKPVQTRWLLFCQFLSASKETFSINFGRFKDSKAVGGNDDSEGQKMTEGSC